MSRLKLRHRPATGGLLPSWCSAVLTLLLLMGTGLAADVPGDTNCDGTADDNDLAALVAALYDDNGCSNADVNGDGRLSAADVSREVELLAASAGATVTPAATTQTPSVTNNPLQSATPSAVATLTFTETFTPTATPTSTASTTPSRTLTATRTTTPLGTGGALAFSTYLGGSDGDFVRDVVTDGEGNIYITGGTASSNFPTTRGVYDTTQNGNVDVFVMKLDPTGQQILWSTFVGGPNHDRAYAIELDPQGNVVIAGRAGPGFPTTGDTFQPTYNGSYAGTAYGDQDAFVAKLSPDGSQLLWASYSGTGNGNRDVAVDLHGDIYLAIQCDILAAGQTPCPTSWFANAFQPTPGGGRDDMVAKVAGDGSQVLWATYIGGAGNGGLTPSIRVDALGQAHLLTQTSDPNMPTTAGAFDRTANGALDMYIAKLSADGSQLLFGTYLGGSGGEFSETHGLALDAQGNVYVAATTTSTDFPTTMGAFQTTYGGTGGGGNGGGTNYPGDGFVSKLSPDGTQLLASTYLGGSVGEGIEGVAVDAQGNVYVSGATYSKTFPVTADAAQSINRGDGDMFAVKLAADFTHLMYGTFLGGTNTDYARTSTTDPAGNMIVAGELSSTNWPTRNALQLRFQGGSVDGGIARLRIGAQLPLTPPP